MISLRNITPSQLAEYIGPWCDESTAAAMLQRLLDAQYETPSEVPDLVWSQMLDYSSRGL